MLKNLPKLALLGSLLLTLVNIIASAFGLGTALTWATGMQFWFGITMVLALAGIGLLIYSWINSLLSNFSGMAIYIVNICLAPFGYEYFGLPYVAGLIIALAPVPFYSGLKWVSGKFEQAD